jgi:endoglucanase
MRRLLFGIKLIIFIIIFSLSCKAQNSATNLIRINQIGFYPNENKIAVIATNEYKDFFIQEEETKAEVFAGKLSEPKKSLFSEKQTLIADFSALTKEGKYVLVVPGLGYSYSFQIKKNVHEEIAKASLKSYYFQRFSTSLPEQFAGKWSRPFSHADDLVLIHPSAASEKRPEGFTISSRRGWIDAGDYNKYIVNSGISTATLLSAYEDFPSYYKTLTVNIPESSNTIPDILDEALWNLRWMLTMQDPNDGGVYHKCTNAKFDGMVMPHHANTQRYVVQKGTGAALNFAAVMAQASRIFGQFEREVPGLADSCLRASEYAWQWAVKNPAVEYNQQKINQESDPDITTGAYGDRAFTDEFSWAASELLVTTNKEAYLKAINFLPGHSMPIPSWNETRLLGYYTLVRFEKKLPEPFSPKVQQLKDEIINLADNLIQGVDARSYMTVMGGNVNDFVWGSNSVAGNQSIALINAYKISNDKKYLKYALFNLDYLLGRNATGYCFVTGYGSKKVMHPHHRPSEADGIEEPVPGLLAGGPNPGMQDKCQYPSAIADEAFVDDVCSYASNEVAINWNAPLVYLSGAMEALQK